VTPRTLKLGDRGDDVADVQRRIGASASGVYDAATAAAVARYQQATGLDPDGIVGPLTWDRLRVLGASTGAPRSYGPGDVGPDGWYPGATRVPAHAGRVGPLISPWGIVIHTTDMMEDTLAALIERCASEGGDGAGFHFVVGRTPGQGRHADDSRLPQRQPRRRIP
jgi:peptidoglycan hydrolase-like protein with peptidoglycan-binding domain